MSFLNPQAKITVSSDPFNYMVIEDVFDATVATSLACLFRELIVDAKGIGKVGEVGELVYDALNFTPLLEHVRTTALAMPLATQFLYLVVPRPSELFAQTWTDQSAVVRVGGAAAL